jgi:hypothetical protein
MLLLAKSSAGWRGGVGMAGWGGTQGGWPGQERRTESDREAAGELQSRAESRATSGFSLSPMPGTEAPPPKN